MLVRCLLVCINRSLGLGKVCTTRGSKLSFSKTVILRWLAIVFVTLHSLDEHSCEEPRNFLYHIQTNYIALRVVVAMANGNSSFAITLTELCSSAAIMSGGHDSGACNDGFLPILYIIQSTFRPLQMHSKRRYKICICSVILWELKSFQNYTG